MKFSALISYGLMARMIMILELSIIYLGIKSCFLKDI